MTLLGKNLFLSSGLGSGTFLIIWIAVILVVFFGVLAAILSRYRKCPSDKIMVIYGRIGSEKGSSAGYSAAKCLHGGATFIWPVIQAYQYLDLTPISISVDLRSALSRQNIRIDVPSKFTVGISTEPSVMQNAAERLLGLKLAEVQELARDIIFGQLRLVIATMDIEEINTDRDKFLSAVSSNVEGELKKIGLRLINVNMTDITDESGYISALGKEAAAKAINDAKISVAEKDRDGNIGAANAEKDQRIQVSSANSDAVKGENEAKIVVAKSDSLRRESEAEAGRKAITAERVAEAKALEESYAAQQEAEKARALREEATMEADVIIKAEIEKRRMEIDAEAEAERIRRHARGDADAIYARMEAQARGVEEMLVRQAKGLSKIVEAAGGDADSAVKMMIADKLEELVKTQVEAISNLKIDKVTVWDGGNTADGGKSSTANFASGLLKSLPPLNDLFEMAGLSLPGIISVTGDKARDKSYGTEISEAAPAVIPEATDNA
ncbi:MAG: flotillin family protein [Oscillospiraceae bacterium]|nr:flotillin family protein [Oscillospiraceae bacterium]